MGGIVSSSHLTKLIILAGRNYKNLYFFEKLVGSFIRDMCEWVVKYVESKNKCALGY